MYRNYTYEEISEEYNRYDIYEDSDTDEEFFIEPFDPTDEYSVYQHVIAAHVRDALDFEPLAGSGYTLQDFLEMFCYDALDYFSEEQFERHERRLAEDVDHGYFPELKRVGTHDNHPTYAIIQPGSAQ